MKLYMATYSNEIKEIEIPAERLEILYYNNTSISQYIRSVRDWKVMGWRNGIA